MANLVVDGVPNWERLEGICLQGLPELRDQKTVLIKTGDGDLLLQAWQNGVRLRTGEQRNIDQYGLIVAEPETQLLSLNQSPQQSVIESAEFTIKVDHEPFSMQVMRSDKTLFQSATDGHFVRQQRIPALARTERGWLMSFALISDEPVYGLGEKWGALNKRGQLIRSYNHDALGVNAEISYKNTPFCWSTKGWGVFLHTPAPVTHAVGYAPWSQRSYCVELEDSALDLFILLPSADTAQQDQNKSNPGADIIAEYTCLTGRAEVPPGWSTGVILSRAYYRDSDEILAAAKQVREQKMPCDVITFDGRAWQDTNTRFAFEWDATRYPDPAKVIAELKALDFKVCVWEYPLISVNHPWFAEFDQKGWLLKDQRTGNAYEHIWDRQAFDDVLTPLPNSGLLDFTHPDAYAFWRDAHKPLFELGVDMIKADFGEQVADHAVAHNGEKGRALHNVYAHLYNRCVYEAATKFSTSGPFIFSRAAWTGSQLFNSQWGGDPQADWEGMMANIRGGLSWGLSGAPFYATDVGGFYKDKRDDELYVRWAQAGIFSAHFRLHGIGEREPWSYSKSAAAAVSKALKLRYRLQTYIEQAMLVSHLTGLPVQRAMVLAFPLERQAWAFENQFMFGEDLLVIPCFQPSGEIEFYLPQGHWYPFDPGADHSFDMLLGGQVYTRTLALDEMAVFARSGTRIPLSAEVQFTAQRDDKAAIEENWIATSTN